MSDARSQLEEVDALIAAAPDDPALQQLREDLLQLMALEEQEAAGQAVGEDQPSAVAGGEDKVEESQHVEPVAAMYATSEPSEQHASNYTAQGTFMEHVVSKEAVAEAPDLGSFQPVFNSSTAKSQTAMKSDDSNSNHAEANANLKDDSADTTTTATTQPPEKKKKKKKKKDDAVLEAKFELPSHLVPLESDTPAQKLKKQRTAKALKSKFRGKQKEAEHAKRQNDWKSFAGGVGGSGGKKKKRKGGVGAVGMKQSSSIFSTEEGVNARVGVISGGAGGRKMTDFADPNKKHKFS